MMLNGVHTPEPTEEEITRLVTEQKSQREAFFKAKQNNLKTVTTHVPHECVGCKQTIPEGTQAKLYSHKTVYGTNYGFETLYFCQTCKPSKASVEAKLSQVLQIKDSALWNMTAEELNQRIVEICIATMGMERTEAQGHELIVINRILRVRGLR